VGKNIVKSEEWERKIEGTGGLNSTTSEIRNRFINQKRTPRVCGVGGGGGGGGFVVLFVGGGGGCVCGCGVGCGGGGGVGFCGVFGGLLQFEQK